VRCVACHRDVNETWAFCSYCGADTRAPEVQTTVGACENHLIVDGEFCVACGASLLELEEGAPDRRAEWFGWALLIGGALWLGASALAGERVPTRLPFIMMAGGTVLVLSSPAWRIRWRR